MDKLYRIGLDIGIGSVGWAVLENDPITEEPNRILQVGVRTFSPNEVDKTGESTAKARRESRGSHRRNRRKNFRKHRIENLIDRTFGTKFQEELKEISNVDVYMLRSDALDRKLSEIELVKVIFNLLKRRGFKSNRKNQSQSKDEGKLKSSISENIKFLEDKGYRTWGEALYKDEKFKYIQDEKVFYNIRNHEGDYRNCVSRDMLKDELLLILNNQKEFNNKITTEFIDKVIEIFESQRNFDIGPGQPSPYSAKFEVGNCTFLKEEKRAPKASYTFELFTALSKVNSLKIDDEELSFEQKQVIIEYFKEKKEVSFAQIRKLLDIPENKLFNLCRYQTKSKKNNTDEADDLIKVSEKSILLSMARSYEIRQKLKLENSENNSDLIDEVALMLSLCKSDSTIEEYISKNDLLKNLSQEQIESISSLNFDKFGSLSIKAMKKVIPYLLQGKRYDEACKCAGFNHSNFEYEKYKYLKGEFIQERLQDVTSNVVKRAVNQTLRIVNEIIKKYGSPQFVTIELARELSKSKQDRNKLTAKQNDNFKNNEEVKKKLKELYNLDNPKGQDILKYRLYEEQSAKCMYSGKAFEVGRLFEPNYVQIDHIIPFSRSMNDSYNNKVLVLSCENQNKGNKTPFEYFGSDEKKWNDFVARVNLLRNKEKRQFLLKENFDEKVEKDFIDRNLVDTQYMARFLYNLFNDFLLTTPSRKYKRVIRCVKGAITNYLRKCWNIKKIREDGDTHHAVDATIIATVTDGQIQKITKFNKFKEKFKYDEKADKYINILTGEVLSESEKKEFEQININNIARILEYPYPEFIKELKLRTRTNYNTLSYTDEEKLELARIGYSNEEIEATKPLFVSRMKTVKNTGAIHEETIMSIREYDESKMLIKSVNLSKLKLCNKPEEIILKDDKYPECSIENYYRPKDDRLLYLKLKNYLKENEKIPDNMDFHKPKKDGTDGPLVKKVKVYEKASNCVITPRGGAANDKMYRVDVFEKNNKYYLCPVYKADVYMKKLPNRVIEIGKEWTEIDDSFMFLFSLYQNDVILLENKKVINLKKNFKNENSCKKDEISNNKFLLYYTSTGITGASISVVTHDNCYKIDSSGVKNLKSIEKYYVDIMGNVYKAPKEERKGFWWVTLTFLCQTKQEYLLKTINYI